MCTSLVTPFFRFSGFIALLFLLVQGIDAIGGWRKQHLTSRQRARLCGKVRCFIQHLSLRFASRHTYVFALNHTKKYSQAMCTAVVRLQLALVTHWLGSSLLRSSYCPIQHVLRNPTSRVEGSVVLSFVRQHTRFMNMHRKKEFGIKYQRITLL